MTTASSVLPSGGSTSEITTYSSGPAVFTAITFTEQAFPTISSVSSTDAKAKAPTEFELAFPTKPVQRTDSASTVSSDDEEPEPQAKWYHAAFHICCAIVGTGVLGLPKAFAALSWAGAIVLLLVVFVATYYVSYIVAYLCGSPDGARLKSYKAMARAVIGDKRTRWMVLPFLYAGVVGVNIAYLIVAGENLNSIYVENCTSSSCTSLRQMVWTSCIAAIELILAFFPGLDELKFVSFLGVVMSVGYCIIAIVMSFVVAPQVPNVSYAVEGSVEDIIFTIFMGITTVVFAFAFTLIAPDIQGTLAAKPEPRREMMKGVSMAYVFTFFAYFLSAISGYYAFGNAVSGDVLLSIAEYATTPAERGAITAAQVMVCIHVTVAYQVFAIVIYGAMESAFVSTYHKQPKKFVKYGMRWGYILLTWFVAIAIPFFSDIQSLIGAISYVPLCFVIPCSVYLMRREQEGRPVSAGTKILLYSIIVASIIVGIVGCIASIRQIILDSSTFQLFK